MKSHAEKRRVLFPVLDGLTEEHLRHTFHALKEPFRHDKTALVFPIYVVSHIQKASNPVLNLSVIRVAPSFLNT